MELFETILSRRSYRGMYQPTPVPREDLKKILEATLAAPSGCNKQTTSAIAVDDPELIRQFGEMMEAPNFGSAPAGICILTEKKIAYRDRSFYIQDYSAAIENALLAICALGYESCWVEGHITDADRIGRRMADLLGVPEELELVCYLPVGKPAQEGGRAKKLPFEERAWFNGWRKAEPVKPRANIQQLLPHLWLIDDAGESTCYLIEGKTHAMLIDTANGEEDLRAIVEGLTSLPVIVVNTHGHGDHIFGNVFFQEAWIHPADAGLAETFMGYAKEEFDKRGLKPCPLKPLAIGQEFDLGGLTLEVIPLPGHTPGSIGLLDRQDRILFTGDGVNTHLWMQLEGCSTIAELKQMLLSLKEQYGDAFDWILHGHDKGLREAAVVDQLIAGCQRLLDGQTEKDTEYHYFGGQCLQHPISDVPGQVIVYTKENIR